LISFDGHDPSAGWIALGALRADPCSRVHIGRFYGAARISFWAYRFSSHILVRSSTPERPSYEHNQIISTHNRSLSCRSPKLILVRSCSDSSRSVETNPDRSDVRRSGCKRTCRVFVMTRSLSPHPSRPSACPHNDLTNFLMCFRSLSGKVVILHSAYYRDCRCFRARSHL
jgi:hypothetical protein